MKKIYIILTNTGTILSRIIRIYTKKEFAHVSIALDKGLNNMYSFGRLNPYTPLFAGFVQESPKYGTFKRFKNTTTCIYSVDVSEEQYEIIKNEIEQFKAKRKIYKFNIIGLFAVALNIKIKSKNSFYCAEFVKEVLQKANIANDLPIIIKPEDFRKLENLNMEYTGKLSEYNIVNNISA